MLDVKYNKYPKAIVVDYCVSIFKNGSFGGWVVQYSDGKERFGESDRAAACAAFQSQVLLLAIKLGCEAPVVDLERI